MKSVVLQTPGQLQLAEIEPPPPPGEGEVQVRVRRVGICGTDLHAFTGTQPFFNYPRILGHELALEVLDIGPSAIRQVINIGDRCCLLPYMNCGQCGPCRRGFENACINMQVLGVQRDGGMREIINVPADKIYVSSHLADEELALVEMLSIGCHAVRRAQVAPGEVVLVIGMGPIGLGVAQFAHLAGARVIVMDISTGRLDFAASQPGIAHCIDARQDVQQQLKAIIPDDLPTVIFDATGNAQSMMQSFRYVAHGGRLVFVGLFQGEVVFNDPDFHKREVTLLASRNATDEDFRAVISALENHKIEVKSWITHHASPEQLVQDFSTWLDPKNGVVKAMLSF